jgi:hypothetical protein
MPESRFEVIDGRVVYVSPADEPHATQHAKLNALVEAFQGLEQGLEQGRVAGKAAALVALLEARGFAVTEGQRARILEAPDGDLDRWLVRVLTATDTADALGG